MAGYTDYFAKGTLNLATGKTAFTLPSPYLALFTAVGSDAGSGFTEVTGGSYARVAASGAAWNAATGSDPSVATNASALSFTTATANWGTVLAWGLYDASTAGNLIVWDFMGNNPWFPFVCTLASPGVLTAYGVTAGSTSFANGSIIVVDAQWGGTLPTGLVLNTQYTVAGLSADSFNVGVNTSTVGSGMLRQVNAVTVNTGTPFSFAAGALTLTA